MKAAKASSLGIICMTAVLFAGCITPSERLEQKRWIKKLNKEFDDKFEYDGPGNNISFGQNSKVAYAKSKEYPDTLVAVRDNDGELETDYNYIRYKEDIDEFVDEYFEDMFECDSYTAELAGGNQFTPIEDMSRKTFIEDYLVFRDVRVTLVKEDGDFESDEEFVEKLTAIAKDRDQHCTITVYCCLEEPKNTEDRVKNAECYYFLCMEDEDTILYIQVTRDGEKEMLVEDLDL